LSRSWPPEVVAVIWIVAPTIGEIFPQTPTNFHPPIRRHCEIALVKEAVEVSAQEEAITDFMRTTCRIRFDMRSLKGGKRMFVCNGAAFAISLRHRDPKCPLPESWRDESGEPVSWRCRLGYHWERA